MVMKAMNGTASKIGVVAAVIISPFKSANSVRAKLITDKISFVRNAVQEKKRAVKKIITNIS